MRENLRRPNGPGEAFLYRPRGRLHPRHSHDELEINLVVAGHARWVLNDRCYAVARGSMVLLFPDQEHLLVDLSDDFAMWILVIDPQALRSWCHGEDRVLMAASPTGNFHGRLDRGHASRLEALVSEVARMRGDPVIFRHGLAFATLSLWRAFQQGRRIGGTVVHVAVEQALERLRTHDESLASLAAHVGLSASRLRHLVHQQLGESLVTMRNRGRIARFIALAENGRRRLDVCALQAGFGTYMQCHRVFCKQVGVNPSTWLAAETARRQRHQLFPPRKQQDQQTSL